MRTPLGRERVTTQSRTASPLDPGAALLDEETVTTVNGRAYRRRHRNVAGVRTVTETSPANRQRVLTPDALGRVVAEQVSGLAPTTIEYADGLVTRVVRSDGSETRTFQLTYDPVRRLVQTLTDPALGVAAVAVRPVAGSGVMTMPGAVGASSGRVTVRSCRSAS